jgi:hypothetical protein
MGAEPLNLLHHEREQPTRGEFAALLQCLDQALLSKLLFRGVERFGYAVGVKDERVAGVELAFFCRRVPVFK